MRKNTLKKLLVWTAGVLLFLAIGVYFAFDYATTYVLRSIADSSQSVLQSSKEATETTKVAGGSSVQNSDTATNEVKQGEASINMPTNQTPTMTSTNSSGDGQTKVPANPKQEPASSTAQLTPQQTPQPPSTPPVEGRIAPEQAKRAQEEISLKDKTKVTSILLSKLSASDIKMFMSMSESGVSVEEKTEAKKIILQKLSEDEYNELIAIAAKLGLSSSGMNYQDSQKEMANLAKP